MRFFESPWELEALASNGDTPQKIGRRARIVLLTVDSHGVDAIMREARASKPREQRLAKMAELVAGGIEETFAYDGFPEEHWRRIRTNKPRQRISREIRRRTRFAAAVPDGGSALNLAAARLRHIAASE